MGEKFEEEKCFACTLPNLTFLDQRSRCRNLHNRNFRPKDPPSRSCHHPTQGERLFQVPAQRIRAYRNR